jgi:hypothetical protein
LKWPHPHGDYAGVTGWKGPGVESKVELFAAIRHDARVEETSIRAL